jgi:hypothetical protein
MPGFTNRGKTRLLEWGYIREHAGGALPTNLYVALVTSGINPDQDINTLGELVQIETGNGYADGGYSLTPGATDFDYLNEDDATDIGQVQVKDVVWTASGGELPSGGSGARFAVLTDDDGTIANREVLCYWDLSSDRVVSDGQTLTLQDCELQLTET